MGKQKAGVAGASGTREQASILSFFGNKEQAPPIKEIEAKVDC
jgi:hypothetical protein